MRRLFLTFFVVFFLVSCDSDKQYTLKTEDIEHKADDGPKASSLPPPSSPKSEKAPRSTFLSDQGAPTPFLSITVHKTPTCGCCSKWVEHLKEDNFDVTVVDHNDLSQIKQQYGVPQKLHSCHTAVVNGMFIEGHVPARDIRRLVEMAPHSAANIKGIAVGGMPLGSPGMEMDGQLDKFDVVMVDEFGEDIVLSSYGK